MKPMQRLAAFLACRRGGTVIEYCLIAALITIGLVGALTSLGQSANGMYMQASDGFGA